MSALLPTQKHPRSSKEESNPEVAERVGKEQGGHATSPRRSEVARQGLYYSAAEKKKIEYLWPKDTLWRYFQIMESMQENFREYQELQLMAAWTIHEVHDT
jgi:hypothetical protein